MIRYPAKKQFDDWLLFYSTLKIKKVLWDKEKRRYKKMAVSILCYTCKHNPRGRCELYKIPILHDTRYCDGYERKNEETGGDKKWV